MNGQTITRHLDNVTAEFPNLPLDVTVALAEYDAMVETGEITFAENGRQGYETHPEAWSTARFSITRFAGITHRTNHYGALRPTGRYSVS